MITKVYAKLNWSYTEDDKVIYLNHQPLAEKITIDHPSSTQPITVARIIRTIRHQDVLLFKKGNLYNAPYCCIEGTCPEEDHQTIDDTYRQMLEKSIQENREKEIIIFNHYVAKQFEPNSDPQLDQHELRTRLEINKAVNYIKKNYDKKISVDEIAEHAALSKPHFRRVFKNQTGKTPFDYLWQCRLEQAKAQLDQTDQQITTIALQCGFKTISHFCELFKQHYKTTPKQYLRKNIIKNDHLTI